MAGCFFDGSLYLSGAIAGESGAINGESRAINGESRAINGESGAIKDVNRSIDCKSNPTTYKSSSIINKG